MARKAGFPKLTDNGTEGGNNDEHEPNPSMRILERGDSLDEIW